MVGGHHVCPAGPTGTGEAIAWGSRLLQRRWQADDQSVLVVEYEIVTYTARMREHWTRIYAANILERTESHGQAAYGGCPMHGRRRVADRATLHKAGVHAQTLVLRGFASHSHAVFSVEESRRHDEENEAG